MALAGYKADDIKIDFMNAEGDQSKVATMSKQLVSNDNDVLIGIATPSAQGLAAATKDKPIVMGAITDPVGANLVKNLEKPGGNITGVSDHNPAAQQLELIKKAELFFVSGHAAGFVKALARLRALLGRESSPLTHAALQARLLVRAHAAIALRQSKPVALLLGTHPGLLGGQRSQGGLLLWRECRPRLGMCGAGGQQASGGQQGAW